MVCVLLKAMNGTKGVSPQFCETVAQVLLSFGFVRNPVEGQCYYNRKYDVTFCIHGNDFLIERPVHVLEII